MRRILLAASLSIFLVEAAPISAGAEGVQPAPAHLLSSLDAPAKPLLGAPSHATPSASPDRFDLFAEDYRAMILESETLARTSRSLAANPQGAHPLRSPFGVALEQFSHRAKNLAARINQESGPSDLACIYRGIAGDLARKRADLEAISDPSSMASQLNALALLFDDAALVTPRAPDADYLKIHANPDGPSLRCY